MLFQLVLGFALIPSLANHINFYIDTWLLANGQQLGQRS
ncbi:hypothetical protein KSS87_019972, partial [Heliosperma pusillum]